MKVFFLTLLFTIILQSFVVVPVTFAVDAPSLSSLSQCSGADCSACNVVYLANGLIVWLIGMAFLLFAVLFCIAGVRLVTSGGNSHVVEEAKGSFINAIVGLIIILSAWLIVDTIMRGLVGTAGHEGQLTNTGSASGWLFWSEVECQVQTVPDEFKEWSNPDYLRPVYENEPQENFTNNCSATGLTPSELASMGCTFSACTTPSCLTSCMNVVKGGTIGKSDNGNYCAVGAPPTGGTVTPVPVSGMQSLRSAGLVVANWEGINGPGRTDLANPAAVSAALAMQNAGKAQYGKQPFQVTAAYTDGVGHHDGSQHYNGLAIDFQPINGFTYEQIAQLARAAGFHYVLIEAANHHVHADMR